MGDGRSIERPGLTARTERIHIDQSTLIEVLGIRIESVAIANHRGEKERVVHLDRIPVEAPPPTISPGTHVGY